MYGTMQIITDNIPAQFYCYLLFYMKQDTIIIMISCIKDLPV